MIGRKFRSFSEEEPKRLLLFCALLILVGVPCAADAVPKLERVVIVARHGVRSPTGDAAKLQRYAAEAWPEWPVAPGELTPHGAANATLAGAWLRTRYASMGLLPATGCPAPGDVAVWSDGKDHRTVATGAALLDGFAPGCGIENGHAADGRPDPVFSGIESGACPVPPGEAASLVPVLQDQLDHLPDSYTNGMAALRMVLGPTSCKGAGGTCWWDEKNVVRVSDGGVKLQGPLATGASLAEALSLEFQEGFAGASLGWGRLDATRLETIMAVHNLASALIRRNQVIASHNGAVLAQRVLSALSGELAPLLTIFVGHDTTLDNLAGIFGLDWVHPGQADATPPDGMLAFELFRDEGGREKVAISFIYQTALQLRERRLLNVSDSSRVSPVSSPMCGDSNCSVQSLREMVAKTFCGKRE